MTSKYNQILQNIVSIMMTTTFGDIKLITLMSFR